MLTESEQSWSQVQPGETREERKGRDAHQVRLSHEPVYREENVCHFWLVADCLDVWGWREAGVGTSLHGLLLNTVDFNLHSEQTESLPAYLVWLHGELMDSVVVIQIP